MIRIMFLAVIMCFVSGCRATEIEGRSFVSSAGWEKNNGYSIYMSYIKPEGENIYSAKNIEVENSTPYFTDKVLASMEKQIYPGHIKAVIMGKSVYTDRESLKEVLYSLSDNNSISMDTAVLAAEEDTGDIIKNLCESSDGLYIRDFYRNNENNMPMSFRIDIADTIKYMDNSDTVVIPLIRTDGDGIKIENAAALKNDKYRKIDGREFEGYMFFKGDIKSLNKTIGTGKEKTVFEIVEVKNKTKFYDGNGEIIVNFKSDVSAKMVTGDLKDYNKLKKEITESLEEMSVIITEEEMDILGIKEIIKRKEPKLYEKYKTGILKNIRFIWDINVKDAV